MNQNFLRLIRSGATAEIADAVHADPPLAAWRDAQGVSALLWSIYSGQAMVRDFLLTSLGEHSIPLDIFEAAAIGDDVRLAALLQEHPEQANHHSGDGWTLLQAGANVAAVSTNAQASQPLHAALALGRNPEIIRLLLEHGAKPNATQAGGFTPIFSAASANRIDLAELLLAHGARAHHRCDAGKSPADFARERGHTELADWLEARPV